MDKPILIQTIEGSAFECRALSEAHLRCNECAKAGRCLLGPRPKPDPSWWPKSLR